MAGMDKAELFSRLRELRAHQGKGWNEIASILEGEGYEEKGKPLTANALRKRFTRWSKTEMPSRTSAEPEPEPAGFRIEGQRDRHGRQLDEAELGLPGSKIASSLANLVSLNNQLLEQVRQSNELMKRLETRLEEQQSKTSHTEYADEQPVTTRDLLELLKEITAGRMPMRFIEEEREDYVHREEILQLLEERVQDKVDAELKAMLAEEGSFSRQLAFLVDERLKNLFSGGVPVPQTAHAGPGRGKRGKTHKKFSASLEESLFERVKGLPGQFSGHLSNALEAYLSVVEEKKPD